MSNSLWSHRLQHARLPCPSLFPSICSDSCRQSQWGHLTISFSVIPFSSCPQSFPASVSFPISWPLASGGQCCIGASASAPVFVRCQNLLGGKIPFPNIPSHWESLLCDYMVYMRTFKAILPNKYIQGQVIPQACSVSSASLIYNITTPQMTYYLDSL